MDFTVGYEFVYIPLRLSCSNDKMDIDHSVTKEKIVQIIVQVDSTRIYNIHDNSNSRYILTNEKKRLLFYPTNATINSVCLFNAYIFVACHVCIWFLKCRWVFERWLQLWDDTIVSTFDPTSVFNRRYLFYTSSRTKPNNSSYTQYIKTCFLLNNNKIG